MVGIYQFTCQILDIISVTLYYQKLGRWTQTSNFVTSYKNIPVSDLVSLSFFGTCPLPSPAVVGSQVFPAKYQWLEVKGPFSHLSIPHFPSPSTPTTAKLLLMLPLVPMSTRPLFTGKLGSFAKNCCCTIWQSVNFLVAWMFVRKQKLKAQNPNRLQVILQKRGKKTQTSSLLLAFSHSKYLCRSPGLIPVKIKGPTGCMRLFGTDNGIQLLASSLQNCVM